jgi:hypothetical protein
VQDQKIASYEDTPLCVGFRLYRVDMMDQEEVTERLRSCLSSAGDPRTEQAATPRPGIEAWLRLRDQRVQLNAHDLYSLKRWFVMLAKDPRAIDLFPTEDWDCNPMAFTDRQVLSRFHQILADARSGAPTPAPLPEPVTPPRFLPEPDTPPRFLPEPDTPPSFPPEPVPPSILAEAPPPAAPAVVPVPPPVLAEAPPPEALAVGPVPPPAILSRLTQAQVESAQASLWRASMDIVGALIRKTRSDQPLGLVFDHLRENGALQSIFVDAESLANRDVWFIGDIHGDFLGLEASLEAIRQRSADPTFVFLGDFIDRGDASPEVLLRIYQLILDHPDRICILAGNHSDGLGTLPDQTFFSSVSPGDFVDLLNSKEDNLLWHQFGQLAVTVAARIPRALFFPDGLLVAHGGIPLTDLHPSIQNRMDLNQASCLQDFVWTRAHPSAARKIPNRYTRGSEFGVKDFNAFCELMADRVGFPVERMIRGHCHLKERYAIYEKYQLHPVLTINNMCHRMPDESFDEYECTPCVAHWVPGQLPQVHRVQIDAQVVQALCPPPADA